jgi:uncharacterized protein YbjT (DUF2867 family)
MDSDTTECIAIFGAAGRIGTPLTLQLMQRSPGVRLRLISRHEDQARTLRTAYPGTETHVADYFDLRSLRSALADVTAIFVITPHFLDEQVAMTNLVSAIENREKLRRILRIVGYHPGSRLADVPRPLRDFGSGVATQHFIAQQILEASQLPVAFLNLGASMMDNFLRNAPLRSRGVLVWPPRVIPYVDPQDVGEAAAILLLSQKVEHLGKVLHLNNNHDLKSGPDVAALMSGVAGRPIGYDGSRSAYLEMASDRIQREYGVAGGAEYLWEFFEYERSIESHWMLDGTLQRILGHAPKTLLEWVTEHRTKLFAS